MNSPQLNIGAAAMAIGAFEATLCSSVATSKEHAISLFVLSNDEQEAWTNFESLRASMLKLCKAGVEMIEEYERNRR